MSCFRNIKASGSAAVAALAGLLLVNPTPALAQGSVEDLYQRATQAWNNMDTDRACELFQEIERQSPGYKDVRMHLPAACASAKALHTAEETLFNQCKNDFAQNKLDDAKLECQNALDKSKKLVHPRYRDQANQILRLIEAQKAANQTQQQCAKTFAEASSLAGQGKLEEARNRFGRVIEMSCPETWDAQARIRQIDAQVRSKVAEADREKRAEEALNDCRSRYSSHDLHGAQASCQEVVRLNGKRRREAENLLAKITEELTPPPPIPVSGNEDLLKAGLRAYFNGDFKSAETSLTQYVEGHGAKSALAYFFRGAARSSRYFLSGEKESDQKNQALADFRNADRQGLASGPPERFVPPKILALYREAISTSSQ